MPYTEKRWSGKMEGCYSEWIGNVLYDICGMSGYDDDLGEVDGFGWYALIHGKRWSWIVHEDSQGFFDYDQYPDALSADEEWGYIEGDHADYLDGADDYDLDA